MKNLLIQNSNNLALVDDEDFDRLSKFNWRFNTSTIQRSATRSSNYRVVSLASEVMHQSRTMFDHIDRNPFNNQKSNLRSCTYSQNLANRTRPKGGTSKYRGVHRDTKNHKWVASIGIDKKKINLGRFMHEEDAAKAYNEAALKFFNEFAQLNIIV